MSKERVKNLLAQLRRELRDTDIDDELEKLIGDLDDDIQNVIDETDVTIGGAVDMDDVVERAKELEANFATSHPTAERVVREVIDLLVRMGI
jgi:hypothetical protein